jgi:nitrate/nitrite transporter NarK
MLVSAMTNRFGYRKITILGAIVTAVGFLLSSFATELYHLYITFGILPGIAKFIVYIFNSLNKTQNDAMI